MTFRPTGLRSAPPSNLRLGLSPRGGCDNCRGSISVLAWKKSPAGLGWWLHGTAFLLDDPDALLVSMEVAPQIFVRVLHASEPFNPWVKPFGLLDQTNLMCMAQGHCGCVSLPLDQWCEPKTWHLDSVPGRRTRAVGLGFSQFASFLVHLFLYSQLIQNLWNFIEISKLCMEHSAKLCLFPRIDGHNVF
jgi:hypothetical protein